MSLRRVRGQGRFTSSRIWLFVAIATLALVIGVVIAGKTWVDSYLRSGSFRSSISSRAGKTLKAEAEIAPLTVSGQNFYTDGLKAKGTTEAWFSDLQLDQVRAELSTRRFWEGIWQVEQVSVQRARIAIDGTRIAARPNSGQLEPPKSPSLFANWIPNRVEVGAATIRETEIRWKGGAASGTTLQVVPQDGGWNIVGENGRLVHKNLPPLDFGKLKLRYREPSLFVQEAELRQSAGGNVRVSGEVRLGNDVDLLAKLDRVTMTPYLAGDWRARVSGKLSGEVRVQSPLPAQGFPVLSGTLSVSEGHLEALPILNEIATFTRTTQFRRINLTRATGEFRHDGEHLFVRNFLAESEGLICLEGAFTINRGQIDGEFQVGVTPSSLQWLPGSQDRVFTVARGGYLWTPLRLTGPVDSPREDLSPRLIAAAKGAIIESAEGVVRDATQTARDALKSGLDLLLGK